VHELAASPFHETRPDLELVQGRALEVVERLTVIRCPRCKGLRSCWPRHERRRAGLCADCKEGRVVTSEQFFGFWLEHFSNDEIDEMAQAIFG
jgi:hypothetical protein